MRKATPDTPIQPPPADRDLVARAYRKVMDGQKPSREEQAALQRFEKTKEERLRWQYYGSIPQKHWRQMSGRQTKVLNEQATRYGIPFGGPTIDLRAVARAVHDFLADNAVKLARDDDPLMEGSGSPALERYRAERATLAKLDRQEREGELISVPKAREVLDRIAELLRSAGDSLQRQFGPGAVDVLQEALSESQRLIDSCFAGAPDDEPDAR